MKKVHYLFTVIIIILLSYLVFLFAVQKDKANWENWGKTDHSQSFYLYPETVKEYNDSKIHQLLKKLATDYEVTLIKSASSSEKGKVILHKGVYINGEAPVLLDKNHQYIALDHLENQILTTEIELLDYFNDDVVQVTALDTAIAQTGVIGDYYIISKNREKRQLFLNHLSKELHIEPSVLMTQKRFVVSGMSTQQMISYILVVLSILFYAVLQVFQVIKQSKKIAVLRLNGYSHYNIIIELLKKSLIYTGVISLVSYGVIKIGYNPSGVWDLGMAVIFVAIGSIQLVFTLITYYGIQKQSLPLFIKGKNNLKFVLIISKVFQVIFIAVSTYFIISSLSLFNELTVQNESFKRWEPLNDYTILTNMSIGDDLDSAKGNSTQLVKDSAKFYDFLETRGAEYFEVSENSQYTEIGYPIVMNINFMKRHLPLWDTRQFFNGEQYLLIPKSLEQYRDKIEQLEQQYYESLLSFLELRNLPTISNVIHTIIYDEMITLFDYRNGVRVTQPIIKIKHSQNMGIVEKDVLSKINLFGAIRWKNIHSEDIQNYLENSTLQDNNIRFNTIENVLLNQRENIKKSFYWLIVITIFVVFCSVFVRVQEAHIHFESYKKDLAIKKLNGYSLLQRHWKRLMINSFICLMSTLLSCVIMKLQMNIINSLVIFLFFVSYILSEYWFIQKDEKAIIQLVIKGE